MTYGLCRRGKEYKLHKFNLQLRGLKLFWSEKNLLFDILGRRKYLIYLYIEKQISFAQKLPLKKYLFKLHVVFPHPPSSSFLDSPLFLIACQMPFTQLNIDAGERNLRNLV